MVIKSDMKIELNRVNKAAHYEAIAPSSTVKVNIDGPESIGGEGKGVRPMELVLIALGSCSVFDLNEILKKQRQDIEDIKVEVKGNRRDEIPNIFTDIHIKFFLAGNIDLEKANKAAELAVKKYCSVHDMLATGGVNITYEININ
jgi:putative redox protein